MAARALKIERAGLVGLPLEPGARQPSTSPFWLQAFWSASKAAWLKVWKWYGGWMGTRRARAEVCSTHCSHLPWVPWWTKAGDWGHDLVLVWLLTCGVFQASQVATSNSGWCSRWPSLAHLSWPSSHRASRARRSGPSAWWTPSWASAARPCPCASPWCPHAPRRGSRKAPGPFRISLSFHPTISHRFWLYLPSSAHLEATLC